MSSLGKPAKRRTRAAAKTVPAGRPPLLLPQESEGGERGVAADTKAVPAGSLPQLLNIGYGNLVIASRVVAVVSPQSSPMRRLREEASERGKLVDATHGRRTRSILVTDSDHVILSAVNPETIASRLMPDESEGGS